MLTPMLSALMLSTDDPSPKDCYREPPEPSLWIQIHWYSIATVTYSSVWKYVYLTQCTIQSRCPTG